MQGVQQPRVSNLPPYASTSGDEAIELAAMAGLDLDPWQQYVLKHSLGERPDGKWAAFEVGLVVSRQNGKGSILEARELAGLFLLGERLIVHTAHRHDTSMEHFLRVLDKIEGCPELDKRIKSVTRSHGEQGITLKSGQRLKFKTRTNGGARGFTADLVVLDEAMNLPDATLRSLMPTLSTVPNPQIWYTGSAVDQAIEEHGVVLARIRERGLTGTDKSLAYFEWSASKDLKDLTPEAAEDPQHWAEANPSMGIHIPLEYIENEYASFKGGRGFWVERLGVGDWPSTDPEGDRVLSSKAWAACLDPESVPEDPIFYAFDLAPDRSSASICAAGFREDGKPHIEVGEHRKGPGWVVGQFQELAQHHRIRKIYCDGYGPAGSLADELEQLGFTVERLSARDMADACGMFYDAVMDSGDLRHLGTPELTAAVNGASTRPLGGTWAWGRKESNVDISPLVGCTIAHWALRTGKGPVGRVINLNDIDLEG